MAFSENIVEPLCQINNPNLALRRLSRGPLPSCHSSWKGSGPCDDPAARKLFLIFYSENDKKRMFLGQEKKGNQIHRKEKLYGTRDG
jgi:hypothetical protein